MANNDYITTDCKLTVSKNTAKLDEEIFLYKNDRNIKLLIEIVDNKYRYKSDDLSNLLVKYKASYAQVKWYKNAEVKKEFPIQATDDGKVVFVIEGQLIDEDTELGDYDLQLRLLNESQESIRSLPIIKGAVHILKPLFEEGDIATVNSAVADVSMLSLDGDAIDTYNSDGTYNQTNWGNGDVISSAKLNKLEKVAKDNVDKVNKIPAKSIVEGGKIYLAKEDGTKLDSGTELPAGGTGTSYDDTEIKSDINTIKTDLGTEELTTTAKDVKGAVNEVAAQYKDIANKTVVENGKLYLVKNDGTKIDEGTVLPTSKGEKGDPGNDGTSVTISSVVESTEDGGNNVVTFSDGTVLNVKNGNKGDGGTSESSNSIEAYKTEYIGELYPSLSDYCAWCPCDLHFDKTLDKYVMLIYSTTAHLNESSSSYVIHIDKDTFVSTEPVKCKFVDSDGTTDITPTKAGSCSYIILKDGTYLMIRPVSDGSIRRLISEDNGMTWKSTNTLTDCFSHPWQIKELSNGRIICSDDSKKVGFMYSDDKGITWSKVAPATCGGGYEAEAFFVELEPNKLMAIARYSMSGIGYNEIGDSESAIISYSDDNGTSWTGWQKSTSITNMNASSCTGIVHDGIVEIFANSRWYYVNDSKYNNDWKNTGKNGAMFHYVATIENAKNDKFTNMGVVTYANTTNATDFHSPCIALDDSKNGLIVYFDKIPSATCGHNFIRCTNKTFTYVTEKNSNSSVKSYSSRYVNALFNDMLGKINTLQYAISQIPGSGVDTPTGTLIWTKEYDANTATESLALKTYNGVFKNYMTVPQYSSNPSMQTLGEDTLKAPGNKTAQTYSMVINIPVEKTNFAGYIYCRTGKIDGTSSSSYTVRLCAVIDNILYTLKFKGSNTDYTELYIEYNGGKKIFKKDNVEITPEETVLDSSHELYGSNHILVGYGGVNNNNYVCYRNVKFGEWDS